MLHCWTTSNLHAGRFTAACGVLVYKGGVLPAKYHGAAFTCDPTGNLVHCEVVKPHGGTFRSTPHRKGVEFLASPDDWFRPVSLAEAPDGTKVALKLPRKEVRQDPKLAERFAREVSLSLSLRHPHLIQGLHGVPFSEEAFLALEYLEEGTLEERLRARMSRSPEL